MAEFKVYIKNVKMSPKKLRFLVADVKKQKPAQAIHSLMYTQKKGAVFLRKAIASALSNAKNTMQLDESLLQFKTIAIEEGLRLKRFRAGSKGMAKPIRHEYAHIKLVLTTGKQEPKEVVKVEAAKSIEAEVKTEKSKVKSTTKKVKV